MITTPLPLRTVTLCLGAALVILTGCADNTLLEESASAEAVGNAQTVEALSKADAARRALPDDLLDREGIEGVGTRLNPGGQPQLVVYARSANAAAAANIPSHVQGVPTSVMVTGLIMARSDETSKARPAPIGFSVGHPDITAGTIGARVKNASGNIFILSNNHVLANSNNASVGDNTLQPGPYDGGSSADVIGTLADFEEISFNGNNQMDAAIASVDGADLNGTTPVDEGYGAPGTATRSASLGMLVQKYGRTTGHTHGQVAEINVTVDVCYTCANPLCTRCAESARFVDQIGISDGSFSDGGDSGSLIVTDDNNKNPVGLLFAGGGDRTFANPIQPVLDRFGVSIDPTSGGDGGGPGEGGDEIILSASAYKVRGLQKTDLSWSGASSSNVDIYRDGSILTRTANDGAHTDNIDGRGGGSYTYRVCEAGTSTCSNTSLASF